MNTLITPAQALRRAFTPDEPLPPATIDEAAVAAAEHRYIVPVIGKATEIEIQAKEMLRMREWLENTLAKHTGRDIEKIRKDIEVDTFLTAQEAKEYGIVDEVLEHRS